MNKKDLLKKKRISLDSKHISYNLEILNGIEARYHVVAVGFHGERNQILGQFLNQITKISSLSDYKEVASGKVKSGPLEYKCVSFSANVKPSEININEIDVPVIKDPNLREIRSKGKSLEIYVDNKYGRH